MTLPKRFTAGTSESGETLVELLISTALMGIVVIAMVAGLAAIVLVGHVHREQADANASLVAAMERVKSPSVSRVVCATPGDYLAGAQPASPLPSGWAISITSLEYENYAGAVSWDTTCHETATSTLNLQRITLQLTTPDQRVNPKLSVVKGDH